MGYRMTFTTVVLLCLLVGPAFAEEDASQCVPQCEDKECGDDGCGAACGTCEESEECVVAENGSSTCEEVCVPDCEGKTCGGDGCEGSCGTCEESTVCLADNCIPANCVGACEGESTAGCFCDASCFQFGDCCDDICVTCGICSGPGDGEVVDELCGKGVCEGCCDQFVYDAPCQCDASCAVYDDCCDDACSACGWCGEEEPQEECPEWLTYPGCCISDVEVKYCSSQGVLKGGPCPGELVCGWNPSGEYYDCVEESEVDPSGANPFSCEDLPGYTPVPGDEGGDQDASGTAGEDADAQVESDVEGESEDTGDEADGEGEESESAGESDADAAGQPNDDPKTPETQVEGEQEASEEEASDATPTDTDDSSPSESVLESSGSGSDGCQSSPVSSGLPWLFIALVYALGRRIRRGVE